MFEKQLNSNYSSVFLIILREILILAPHRGILLEKLPFSNNELDDALDGNLEISLDKALDIAIKLNIPFDFLMSISNRFQQVGVYFQYGKIESENDDLLEIGKQFFDKLEVIKEIQFKGKYLPLYHPNSTFIRYCADAQFRELFNNDKLTELLSLDSNRPSYSFFNL
jgi:hypothetical protein